MEWPQITLIVLIIIGLVIHASENGKPRGDYNFGLKAIAQGILIWLLYMGGFWT